MRNKDGTFGEGNQGRPKGSNNKTTNIGKDKISSYLEKEGYQELIDEIGDLEGYAKVQALLKLMEFVMPKLKATDHTSGGEQIPYSISPIEWMNKKIDKG